MKRYLFLFAKLLSIAILGGVLLSSCDEKKEVTGTTGKVIKVLDGRTILLSNKITVKLLGVEATPETEKFLNNNVKGKRVKLIADSKDTKQRYIVGDNETVNAYVIVVGERLLNSVNGRMIRTEVSKFKNTGSGKVTDSLKIFKSQVTATKLTDAEILQYLKPRTFLILLNDESIGTGFFVSSSGIALTNAHVLNYSNVNGAQIIPFTEDGGYDISNNRKIERILYVGSDEQIQTDFCIFEVSMNGTKAPFVKLAAKEELDGNKVWKLGCVSGEPAHFSNGNISHTRNGIVTHSSKMNQGDSGSPLVNQFGEAIGINQSMRVNGEVGGDVGVYFAVDIQTVRDWFESHRDDEGQLRYGR